MPASGTCGLVGNDVHVPVDMAHGMLVDATLDGKDVNVLIDTGAAVSLLSSSLAEQLGILREILGVLVQVFVFVGLEDSHWILLVVLLSS